MTGGTFHMHKGKKLDKDTKHHSLAPNDTNVGNGQVRQRRDIKTAHEVFAKFLPPEEKPQKSASPSSTVNK